MTLFVKKCQRLSFKYIIFYDKTTTAIKLSGITKKTISTWHRNGCGPQLEKIFLIFFSKLTHRLTLSLLAQEISLLIN